MYTFGMEKLRQHLNGLSLDEQKAFATRCQTTLGYLRKALSASDRLGEMLCLRIAAQSNGQIKPEDLRPDVDWADIREQLAAMQPTPTEFS